MDPFQRLPAELRIAILSMIPSHDTTLHLISASPIMLTQYMLSGRQCFLSFLQNMAGCSSGPVFDEMLQDALGLVYLQDKTLDAKARIEIAKQWKQNALPNPFSTGDDQTIDKLRRLFASKSYALNAHLYEIALDPTIVTYCERLDDMYWPGLYNQFRKSLYYRFMRESGIDRLGRSVSRSEYYKLFYKPIVYTMRIPKVWNNNIY
ncbi:hypothetical protein NXS19_010814 [Fusarium pseudograminearum]|uniref:Uncharacterized protein n=2 Tax=Fusarium pseudograminearum TaxID=101028 RepID=K3V763_FUSPC|nr:hypothetical protein FPSE_10824 [Fusarium pseudograminearum CS3096]EKJ68999.1 hypothetical protein FPSE_10824 [Fusarium pseudograminearum CS3096]UZP42998.1 hypothetical protein NXS19_010814 [Fusarium pseudograminearum]CEG02314.1 unnamed protein product [Fusarium pseudograminearum CS3220]